MRFETALGLALPAKECMPQPTFGIVSAAMADDTAALPNRFFRLVPPACVLLRWRQQDLLFSLSVRDIESPRRDHDDPCLVIAESVLKDGGDLHDGNSTPIAANPGGQSDEPDPRLDRVTWWLVLAIARHG